MAISDSTGVKRIGDGQEREVNEGKHASSALDLGDHSETDSPARSLVEAQQDRQRMRNVCAPERTRVKAKAFGVAAVTASADQQRVARLNGPAQPRPPSKSMWIDQPRSNLSFCVDSCRAREPDGSPVAASTPGCGFSSALSGPFQVRVWNALATFSAALATCAAAK